MSCWSRSNRRARPGRFGRTRGTGTIRGRKAVRYVARRALCPRAGSRIRTHYWQKQQSHPVPASRSARGLLGETLSDAESASTDLIPPVSAQAHARCPLLQVETVSGVALTLCRGTTRLLAVRDLEADGRSRRAPFRGRPPPVALRVGLKEAFLVSEGMCERGERLAGPGWSASCRRVRWTGLA